MQPLQAFRFELRPTGGQQEMCCITRFWRLVDKPVLLHPERGGNRLKQWCGPELHQLRSTWCYIPQTPWIGRTPAHHWPQVPMGCKQASQNFSEQHTELSCPSKPVPGPGWRGLGHHLHSGLPEDGRHSSMVPPPSSGSASSACVQVAKDNLTKEALSYRMQWLRDKPGEPRTTASAPATAAKHHCCQGQYRHAADNSSSTKQPMASVIRRQGPGTPIHERCPSHNGQSSGIGHAGRQSNRSIA